MSVSDRHRRPTPHTSHEHGDPPHYLTREESTALAHRVIEQTKGGGDTQVAMRSTYDIRLEWRRNRLTRVTTLLDRIVTVTRVRGGAANTMTIPRTDDTTIRAMLDQLELPLPRAVTQSDVPPVGFREHTDYLTPTLWGDSTVALTVDAASRTTCEHVDHIAARQQMAAGTLVARTTSLGIFNTRGLDAYAAATAARYTQTVRDPATGGIGWAGARHADWAQLDVRRIADTASEQCRQMAKPRAVEPGRYTTLLGPAAIEKFIGWVVYVMSQELALDGQTIFGDPSQPAGSQGRTKLGQRVVDPRITVTSDPMDPENGYIPFAADGTPHRPVTWIEQGVLRALPWRAASARDWMNVPDVQRLSNPLAFRVTGEEHTQDQLLASVSRGIFVEQLADTTTLNGDNDPDLTITGTTRYGAWLIEQGKLTTPIKSLRFIERPLQLFNRVLAMGRTERGFGLNIVNDNASVGTGLPSLTPWWGRALTVIPPMVIRDFNFIALADAV